MKALFLLLFGVFTAQFVLAQQVPIVRTKQDRIGLYISGEKSGIGGVSKLPKLFEYSFETDAKGLPMAIVSETDSIAFTVTLNKPAVFSIIREQLSDTVVCRFSGISKPATFSKAYIDAHTGKSLIEIPEVYELVNVLYALSAKGLTDKDIIDQETDYYRQVMAHFKPFSQHPAVARFDSLLNASQYAQIKMDSYAYYFQGNELKKSDTFDRVSWGDVNTVDKHIAIVADFAKVSGFRAFFQKHQPYYNRLEQDFQQTIGVASMKQWLDQQFPKTSYSCLKIIASPLVGANQSANWFADNGYREMQAHINLPSPSKPSDTPITRAKRQEIAFTELNHAYENPEAENYSKEINTSFGDLSKWTAGKASSSYSNGLLCFQEYMNWALVTLYHADHVKGTDFAVLCDGVDRRMVERRGFPKFKEFNQELLRLYRNRKATQTVADLFPALLAWAANQ